MPVTFGQPNRTDNNCGIQPCRICLLEAYKFEEPLSFILEQTSQVRGGFRPMRGLINVFEQTPCKLKPWSINAATIKGLVLNTKLFHLAKMISPPPMGEGHIRVLIILTLTYNACDKQHKI
jgi:hypothetical protein